jgi:hypothetical protein
MWLYEVSGQQVLLQWSSYRKTNRERPIIGDRRTPSSLGDIQPDHWLAEYTTEPINLLNVPGRLVDLEPAQATLLEKVCAGPDRTSFRGSIEGSCRTATQSTEIRRTRTI